VKVTVYTQPGCQPCRATIRLLTNRSIPFHEVNVREDVAAAEFVRSLGFKETPVVVASWPGQYSEHTETWAGFHPELIEKLKRREAS
jgi:glutaredoxin-like protein NrdH